MPLNLDNALKIAKILFLAWIGFCAYEYSQNGRYYDGDVSVLDTRTGVHYKRYKPLHLENYINERRQIIKDSTK
tara:strand:- start:671 stop:892 length:222 start_codon:yes stop_codon:yes gene_type:complete